MVLTAAGVMLTGPARKQKGANPCFPFSSSSVNRGLTDPNGNTAGKAEM